MKNDFRKQLNIILKIFDETNTGIFIVKEVEKLDLQLNFHTIQICTNQLESDGYIQLIHGYSQSSFGSITAKGKFFYRKACIKMKEQK